MSIGTRLNDLIYFKLIKLVQVIGACDLDLNIIIHLIPFFETGLGGGGRELGRHIQRVL